MSLRTGFVGLLATAFDRVGGVALAATADTLLVEGYDPENQCAGLWRLRDRRRPASTARSKEPASRTPPTVHGSITALLREGAAVFLQDGRR